MEGIALISLVSLIFVVVIVIWKTSDMNTKRKMKVEFEEAFEKEVKELRRKVDKENQKPITDDDIRNNW